jgi:hypothetical protein
LAIAAPRRSSRLMARSTACLITTATASSAPLPADDPRVLSTIATVERELSIDGFVHRFIPAEAPDGLSELPLGEYEGSFSPCMFWLATSYAKAGQPGRAEAILANAEKIAGELGLFAEGIDARTRDFAGNFPLMFSEDRIYPRDRAHRESPAARPAADDAGSDEGEIALRR